MNAAKMAELIEMPFGMVTQVQNEQDLVLAARQGDISMVKQLINAGVSVNAVDEFGMTPLMLLAAQGLDEGVQLLLDHPACLVNKRTSSMMVALHFAAEKGHVGCVKKLLEHKAVVNVSDDWGETPLIKAAAASGECADDCRHVDVISLLLNNDAKTDMIDLHGCDALIHASRSGSVDAVRVLLKHGANPNHGARALALHEAASFGHMRCVEELLAAGAHPHIRSLHGYQPLELATHMDHASVVQVLLRFTGPIAGDAGDSAVVMAVTSNAVACLSVLLEHGASPDVVDTAGVPVLHVAVELNHSRLVRLLLKYNATVNRRLYPTYSRHHTGGLRDMCSSLSLDYLTPVMLAVLRDRTSVLVPLVDAGASLNGVLRILTNPAVRQRLTALTADSELERWLMERCTTPSSLQLQSALAIRARFSSENIRRIYDLPLPRPLLDFVAFAKLDK